MIKVRIIRRKKFSQSYCSAIVNILDFKVYLYASLLFRMRHSSKITIRPFLATNYYISWKNTSSFETSFHTLLSFDLNKSSLSPPERYEIRRFIAIADIRTFVNDSTK